MDARELLTVVAGFIVIVFQSVQPVNGQCEPPTCFINEDGIEEECRRCPVGHGVQVVGKQLISCQSVPEPRNTQCEPCTPGVNFSDVQDSESHCRSCVPCHIHTEEVLENCTAEHNAVCQCKAGQYYFNREVRACTSCRKCKDDEEEVQACLPSQNRECEKLPPSTVTPSGPVTTPNSTTGKPTPPKRVEVPSEPPTPSHVMDKDNKSLNTTGIIVGCVSAVLILVFFVVIYLKKPEWCCSRNGTDDHPAGTGRQDSTFQFIWNCCTCMQRQTNVGYSHNGIEHMANGTTGNGHAVPNGHNGITRQPSSQPSNGDIRTVAELQPLNTNQENATAPPEERLFTAEEENHICVELSVDNILTLAKEKLGVHDEQLERWEGQGSAITMITYLLDMWAEKEHTRAEFVEALQQIGKLALARSLSND